jgi:hypothetical protein
MQLTFHPFNMFFISKYKAYNNIRPLVQIHDMARPQKAISELDCQNLHVMPVL